MKFTRQELETLRVRFAVALTNLRHVAIYWSPLERRIYARSMPVDEFGVFMPGPRRRALPLSAVRVGVYAHPYSSRRFLDDLAEKIRQLRFA